MAIAYDTTLQTGGSASGGVFSGSAMTVAANGSTLLLFVGWQTGTSSITVADGQGSYTQIGSTVVDSGSGWQYSLFYLANANSGSHTPTATMTGYGAGTVELLHVSYGGASTSAPLDGNNGAFNTNTTMAPGNVTTSASNDVVVLIGWNLGGTGLTTPATGTFEYNGGGFVVMDQAQASPGTATPSCTLAASNPWGVFGVGLKLPAGGPTINTQPQPATVNEGSTAQFSVTATTSGGSLTYQWQDDRTTPGTFVNVPDGSGGTTATYTTIAAVFSTMNGRQYRCVVTDNNGNTNSNPAALTVKTNSSPKFGGTAVVSPVGAAGASGAFQTAGVGALTGAAVQIDPTRVTNAAGAATMTGTTGSAAVVTVEKPTGAATVTGNTSPVTAAAVLSTGTSHRAPVAGNIASVFAGATVVGVGATYSTGIGNALSAGVSTVVATGNDINGTAAASSSGSSTIKGWTPDDAAMGTGAAIDAAVVGAPAGAVASPVGASAANQISTATVSSAGTAVASPVGRAIVGGLRAAAIICAAGNTVTMRTRTGKVPIRPNLRDGMVRRRMAQEQLSAQDEAEILSILPHILDHIAAEEARRMQ
jgi:hypothetical protein